MNSKWKERLLTDILGPDDSRIERGSSHSLETSLCRPIRRIYDALQNGWKGHEIGHVEKCSLCRKRIGMYWKIQNLDETLLLVYLSRLDPAIYHQALEQPVSTPGTSKPLIGASDSLTEKLTALAFPFLFPRPLLALANATEKPPRFERKFEDDTGFTVTLMETENEVLDLLVHTEQQDKAGYDVTVVLTLEPDEKREATVRLIRFDDDCLGEGSFGPFPELAGRRFTIHVTAQKPE